jgi:hypothetical protein
MNTNTFIDVLFLNICRAYNLHNEASTKGRVYGDGKWNKGWTINVFELNQGQQMIGYVNSKAAHQDGFFGYCLVLKVYIAHTGQFGGH